MNKKHVPAVLIGCLGLVVALLIVSFYGDLLGIRLLGKSTSRISVTRQERLTLQLTPRAQSRKIELCVDKKHPITGYYVTCRVLANSLSQNAKTVDVTIPTDFPLGAAVFISRFRDAKGRLLALDPATEKIAVTVKARILPVSSTPPREISSSLLPTENAPSKKDGDSVLPGLNGSRPDQFYICIMPRSVDNRRAPESLTVAMWWKPLWGNIQLREAGDSQWRTVDYYADNYFNALGLRFSRVFGLDDTFAPVVLPNKDYEIRLLWNRTSTSPTYRFSAGPIETPHEGGGLPCEYRRIDFE